MSIDLYCEDYPEWVENLEEYVAYYYYKQKYYIERLDETIWDIARDCKEVPHVGNIYISLIFENLEEYLIKKYEDKVDIAYEINAQASWFSINGTYVENAQDIEDVLEELGLSA